MGGRLGAWGLGRARIGRVLSFAGLAGRRSVPSACRLPQSCCVTNDSDSGAEKISQARGQVHEVADLAKQPEGDTGNRRHSASVWGAAPSTMSVPAETAARRTCDVIPNRSSSGNVSRWTSMTTWSTEWKTRSFRWSRGDEVPSSRSRRSARQRRSPQESPRSQARPKHAPSPSPQPHAAPLTAPPLPLSPPATP